MYDWVCSGDYRGIMVDGFASTKYHTIPIQVGPAPLSVRPTVIVRVPFNPVIVVNTPTGYGTVIPVEVG